MSGVFSSVMTELAAGSSARSAARKLGISLDLAEAVADEATRMGLIVTGSAACGTCVPKSSPACAGCPFSEGPMAKGSSARSTARSDTGTSAEPRKAPVPVTLTVVSQSH